MTQQEMTTAPGGFNFTLRDLLSVGFRHKRAFVLCFCGILAGSIAAMFLVPPTYESKSQILIKRERVDPVVSAEKSNPLQVREDVTEEEINSEADLITSEDVLRKAVVDSDLQDKKSTFSFLNFGISQDAKIAKAVDRLRSHLIVEPVKKTDLIQITYSAHNAQYAATVLNNLVNAYIDKHVAIHRPAGQLAFFDEETNRYKRELDQAEGQLRNFAQEQGGVAPQVSRDITLQKLNEFAASLESTRAEMAATEKKIANLEQQAGSTPDRITTSLRETDDAAVEQQLKSTLMTLELKRTELLTKYQPTYPLVQEVDKQIVETKAAIADEAAKPLKEQTTDRNQTYAWINEELAKAKADYSAEQARAAATQAVVAVYQTRAQKLEQSGLIQQDLLREAKANEDNYLLYLHKREEARIEEALDRTRILNVAMVEQPTIPLAPVRSPLVFSLVGLLLALVVSTALVFAQEYLDTSFRTPAEVLTELKIPVLAAVPLYGNGGYGNGNGNGAGKMVVTTASGGETEHES
ncbi:MAG TPA: Wzz/FepE/Etk N-terminal domain-containing protein [Candidatus Binatia bacterium]|nr:Wzz/FepE/Etk N-terminal domain-containing protein [Candidatus Binatia bacterium]